MDSCAQSVLVNKTCPLVERTSSSLDNYFAHAHLVILIKMEVLKDFAGVCVHHIFRTQRDQNRTWKQKLRLGFAFSPSHLLNSPELTRKCCLCEFCKFTLHMLGFRTFLHTVCNVHTFNDQFLSPFCWIHGSVISIIHTHYVQQQVLLWNILTESTAQMSSYLNLPSRPPI